MGNTCKRHSPLLVPNTVGPAVEASWGMENQPQANDGQDTGFLFQ